MKRKSSNSTAHQPTSPPRRRRRSRKPAHSKGHPITEAQEAVFAVFGRKHGWKVGSRVAHADLPDRRWRRAHCETPEGPRFLEVGPRGKSRIVETLDDFEQRERRDREQALFAIIRKIQEDPTGEGLGGPRPTTRPSADGHPEGGDDSCGFSRN
jgi:hypothetical protein